MASLKTLTLFIHVRYENGQEDRIRFENDNGNILMLFDRVANWASVLTSKDDYIITNYPISKTVSEYDLIED
jgi:hypothetical protein